MEIIKIKDHQPNQTYAYMFDTNIWLFIYGPVAGSIEWKQRCYSRLLDSIIDRKATIYITSLVLSEYINRVLRLGFEQWKRVNKKYGADYKHEYRITEDYKDTLTDATAQVEEILKITQRMPDNFNAINIEEILASMTESSDYNDSYLVKCCEKGKIRFVSDDSDIATIKSDITLIKA